MTEKSDRSKPESAPLYSGVEFVGEKAAAALSEQAEGLSEDEDVASKERPRRRGGRRPLFRS
jgi:hypothetical protein